MGLDMFLTAEKCISSYDFSDKDDKKLYNLICKEVGADLFRNSDVPSLTVNINVGYWRKANAIHVWFVKNVQNGNDDCGNYHVSKETLNELYEVCKLVFSDNSRAEELLPPQAGFFFGSININEWYFRNIEYTIDLLEKLNTDLPSDWEVYYHSYW